MKMDDTFVISNVEVSCDKERIIRGNEVTANLNVTSMFPETLENVSLQISLKYNNSFEEMTTENNKLNKRDSWGLFPNQYKAPCKAENNTSLDLFEHLEYKQDQSLGSASILCRNSENILSHSDSHHWLMKARDPVKEQVPLFMEVNGLKLEPGNNQINMSILVSVSTFSSLNVIFCRHCFKVISTMVYVLMLYVKS